MLFKKIYLKQSFLFSKFCKSNCSMKLFSVRSVHHLSRRFQREWHRPPPCRWQPPPKPNPVEVFFFVFVSRLVSLEQAMSKHASDSPKGVEKNFLFFLNSLSIFSFSLSLFSLFFLSLFSLFLNSFAFLFSFYSVWIFFFHSLLSLLFLSFLHLHSFFPLSLSLL